MNIVSNQPAFTGTHRVDSQKKVYTTAKQDVEYVNKLKAQIEAAPENFAIRDLGEQVNINGLETDLYVGCKAKESHPTLNIRFSERTDPDSRFKDYNESKISVQKYEFKKKQPKEDLAQLKEAITSFIDYAKTKAKPFV